MPLKAPAGRHALRIVAQSSQRRWRLLGAGQPPKLVGCFPLSASAQTSALQSRNIACKRLLQLQRMLFAKWNT